MFIHSSSRKQQRWYAVGDLASCDAFGGGQPRLILADTRVALIERIHSSAG